MGNLINHLSKSDKNKKWQIGPFRLSLNNASIMSVSPLDTFLAVAHTHTTKKPLHNRAVDPKNSRAALTKGDNTLPVPQLVAAQEL